MVGGIALILNIRIDHKTANISTIENLSLEMDKLIEEIDKKCCVKESIQIKTCNRAETYLILEKDHVKSINFDNFIVESNEDALRHLLRLSCGLESMIIGEDQILGQIKDSRNEGLKKGSCGRTLNTIFTKAIHVGQMVRKKTKINKGSISIGSAAVELAESILGDLKCKKVLVIGAGNMGTLVARALVEKRLKAIVVANRTYDRAVELARELGGSAIHFDRLDEAMSDADVVISATGAPHTILTRDHVKNTISSKKLKSMVMVDIANPRDIDENVSDLGVKLFNIDDLRSIADQNKKMRENEAKEAEKIIEKELDLLNKSLKHIEIEPLISHIRSEIEQIRSYETQKALKMLGDLNGKEEIVNDLTHAIINKVFHQIIMNIRNAAENEEKEVLKSSYKIFDIKK
ncbi:MAG: glutamyl-tRNA reductase [Methanobacteriaceae archaeon]